MSSLWLIVKVYQFPNELEQFVLSPDNKELVIDEPLIKSRELFISDATDTYPVSVLRGHCRVDHYADIHAVREFLPDKNSFFYILGWVTVLSYHGIK